VYLSKYFYFAQKNSQGQLLLGQVNSDP